MTTSSPYLATIKWQKFADRIENLVDLPTEIVAEGCITPTPHCRYRPVHFRMLRNHLCKLSYIWSPVKEWGRALNLHLFIQAIIEGKLEVSRKIHLIFSVL